MKNEEVGKWGVFPSFDGMRVCEEFDEDYSNGDMESRKSPKSGTKSRVRDSPVRFGTRRSSLSHDRAKSSSKKKDTITVELSSDGMDQLVDALPPSLVTVLISSLLHPTRKKSQRKVVQPCLTC